MTIGQQVTLIDCHGNELNRILVSVENGVLFVCRREEYRSALQEHREPTCIGFRTEYLVEAELG
jgi:hypothetical protein